MSFKGSVVKMAINMTPDFLVRWIANLILKGIADISEFHFDLDARTLFVELTLLGEESPIEIWVEDFGIVSDGDSRHMHVPTARSNRLWMSNLLNRVTGKAWKIPSLPHFEPHISLLAEVLKIETRKQDEDE